MVKNITSAIHWEQWFELCTLAKCSADAREKLSVFAHKRYEKYLAIAVKQKTKHGADSSAEVNDLIGPGAGEIPVNGIGRCWHDLETSVWYSEKPSEGDVEHVINKSYKKFYRAKAFMIERQKGPAEAVNFLEGSTTSNLIRSRCRKILTGMLFATSDHYTDSEGNSVSSIDTYTLAGENDQKYLYTFDELNQLSLCLFDQLEEEDKFFVLAYYKELNLSTPVITEYFGRKKSALYERQKNILKSLNGKIVKLDHDLAGDHENILAILKKLIPILENWSENPESGVSGLFE